MFKSIKHSFSLIAFIFLLASAFGGVQAAESATQEASIKQGDAAVVLAKRLGLFHSMTENPSPDSAMQLLSARGITPPGGWDADASMTAGDTARLLVQALGLEGELSEAQIASDDPQAYIDLLKKSFGVDVTSLSIDNYDDLNSANNQSSSPFTRDDLNQAINQITGGGSAADSNNIRPSAPGENNISPSAP